MEKQFDFGVTDSGHLDRGDGNRIFWETSGNPDGTPVLYLHGGPGGGLGHGGYRKRSDPARHFTVGIDQRGCGKSTPWAIDDLERLETNTTQTLIADIEAVREHLGVQSWLVTGASWGSTLALAYTLAHPDRTLGIVLMAVTTTSAREVEWITETVGAVYPEAWDALDSAIEQRPGERIVDAFARVLRTGTEDERIAAARAWDAWENAHIGLTPGSPGHHVEDVRDMLNFATLVTHYWSHDGFLAGDQAILARASALEGIPGVLIHGRKDVSGPAITAWDLHRAWPGSELIIDEDEGHGGIHMSDLTTEAIVRLAP